MQVSAAAYLRTALCLLSCSSRDALDDEEFAAAAAAPPSLPAGAAGCPAPPAHRSRAAPGGPRRCHQHGHLHLHRLRLHL